MFVAFGDRRSTIENINFDILGRRSKQADEKSMTQPYILTAYDPETAFEPRQLEFVKPVSSGDRKDCYWANVSPRFERDAFVVSSNPIDTVLLATRHEGESLRRINRPTHVYLCISKLPGDFLADEVEPQNILMLSWALITPADEASI